MFLKLLADYISLIPLIIITLAYIYYCFSLLDLVPVLFSFMFIIAVTSIIIISQFIKKYIMPNFKLDIAKRPKGACDCNFYSNNGIVEYMHGLPSTHMAIVGVISVFSYFFIETNLLNKTIFHLINISLFLLTGWARIYKKCHNSTQVLLGGGLGLIYGLCVYLLNTNK